MQTKQENRLYLPGLNGIRAVAALTVLFGHMFAPFGDWGLDPLPFRIPWPEEPVTTFFSGNISFALGIGLIPLFHYWSLGVEEQYYLWYPWVVKYGKKNILNIVIVLCVLWFVMKCGSYLILGKGIVYRILSITRFDCMLIGAIGAILYYRNAKWFCQLCANRWVVLLSWILFFTSGFYAQYIPAPVRAEYISIISLMVIMAGLIRKPLLENRVMNYLGKISYGIYVIHPLLIFVGSIWVKSAGILSNAKWGAMMVFAVVSLLTILLASISYKYLEMPFLQLKDKYSIVKSTNENIIIQK